MILNFPIISCRISPRHTQTMVHVLRYTGTDFIIIVYTETVKRLKTTVFAWAINRSKGRTYLQVFKGTQLSINIAAECGLFVFIIGIGHHSTVRIAIPLIPITIGCVIIRRIIIIIVAINRGNRRRTESSSQCIVILISNANTIVFLIYKAYLLTYC